MKRDRPTQNGLSDAIPIAKSRGAVFFFTRTKDCPADFEITSANRVAIVCVKRSRRLHCTLTEIERTFSEPIRRFRSFPTPENHCRELWLWSPYGVFRFFRVGNEGIVEIDRDGNPLVVPVPGKSTDAKLAAVENAG